MTACLTYVVFLLLLRRAVRSRRAAVAAFVIAGAAVTTVGSAHPWITLATQTVNVGLFALVVVRFGLLATVAAFYVSGLFIVFPVTSDLRAWYGGAGATALVFFGALAVFGFVMAQKRGPALGRPVFDP